MLFGHFIRNLEAIPNEQSSTTDPTDPKAQSFGTSRHVALQPLGPSTSPSPELSEGSTTESSDNESFEEERIPDTEPPPKTIHESMLRPLSDEERKSSFANELAAWEKRNAFEHVPASPVSPSVNIIVSHTFYRRKYTGDPKGLIVPWVIETDIRTTYEATPPPST